MTEESERQQYRDRTRGYVPTWPKHTENPPHVLYHTIVGNPWNTDTIISRYPVAYGLADELNRDSHGYWNWAQVFPGNSEDPEHWSHFEGHRVRVAVELQTWNERRSHDWKGYDEIRGEGRWKLFFNEKVVYGDYCRDPFEALLKIREVAQKLLSDGGLPIQWHQDDYEGQIVGRKVYYRDESGVIKMWIPEQGCVVLEPDGVAGFRVPAWHSEDDGIFDDRDTVKTSILSPDIWWWRKDRA